MKTIKYSQCCGKFLTRESVLIEKRIDVAGKYKDTGPMICSGCKKPINTKKEIQTICMEAFHSDKPWTEKDDKKRNDLLKKFKEA